MNTLACDFDAALNRRVVRNYHSVAVLLPDGRVLSASGWPKEDIPGGGNPHRNHARIYSPPYLFKAGGTPIVASDRPGITAAPCRIDWGSEFAIQTSAAADIAAGGKVCLIRPAATTHSIDQNQRYVPLTVVDCQSGNRLRVQGPASGDHAPPGDYLLFLVNSAGIPSIAHWLRVGPVVPGGCDMVAPARVDAPDPTVDIVSDTQAWLFWTAPGDDGTGGTVSENDLRAATHSMTDEALFCAGARGTTDEPPSPAGDYQVGWFFGLTPCTQYRFALKARDESANWSPISNEVTVTTICGGGPGGGSSAKQVGSGVAAARVAEEEPGGAAGGSTLSSFAPGGAAGPLGGAGPLTAEAWAAEMRLVDGVPLWSVYAVADDEARALFGADSAGILVQQPGPKDGWLTQARLFPAAASTRFALRRLHQPGRLVLRGPYEFRQAWGVVATDTRGEVYQVASARHSRLGDQTAAMAVSGTSTVALAPGDTLILAYQRSATSEDGQDWFLLMGSAGTVAPMAGNRRSLNPEEPARPAAFALHANQPNPFLRLTTIRFALARPVTVRLEVFDLLGRRVRTLARGEFEAGEHVVDWDGRHADGSLLPAGVYHVRIHAGEFHDQRTMVLLP